VRVKNAFLTSDEREKILYRNVERLLAHAGTPTSPRSN